jgi:hypothetical protein
MSCWLHLPCRWHGDTDPVLGGAICGRYRLDLVQSLLPGFLQRSGLVLMLCVSCRLKLWKRSVCTDAVCRGVIQRCWLVVLRSLSCGVHLPCRWHGNTDTVPSRAIQRRWLVVLHSLSCWVFLLCPRHGNTDAVLGWQL